MFVSGRAFFFSRTYANTQYFLCGVLPFGKGTGHTHTLSFKVGTGEIHVSTAMDIAAASMQEGGASQRTQVLGSMQSDTNQERALHRWVRHTPAIPMSYTLDSGAPSLRFIRGIGSALRRITSASCDGGSGDIRDCVAALFLH